MVIKKKVKAKVSIKAVKAIAEIKPAKKGKMQKLIAERNIAKMKAAGWKVVPLDKGKHGRELGVRMHTNELTLMEK